MPHIAQRPPREALVPPGAIEHHAADMTVTFATDLPLGELQARLRPTNQWLPIDGDPALPLGDLVLANSTGPLRLGYGTWRDLLLGAQLRNGLGELITVGGKVIKNVAGYDVTKLLIGSYGVFGSAVSFTARTWKLPADAMQVALPPDPARVGPLMATALRPHWAVSTPGELLLGYHGDPATIEFFEQNAAGLKPRAIERVSSEDDVTTRNRLWPSDIAARISVPPAKLSEFLSAANLLEFSVDAAFGIVIVPRGTTVDRNPVDSAVKQVGGSALFFNEDGRPADLPMNPEAYSILQRLKTAFDPDGTLPPLPPNRA